MRRLILLRHAKSAWDTGAADILRPLTLRGRRAAALIGRHLIAQSYPIDQILCSPARRARETCDLCLAQFPEPAPEAIYEDGLYAADPADLLRILSGLSGRRRCVLLIGHNPGLDELLCWLLPEEPPRTAKGKLMTTGTAAVLGLRRSWERLEPGIADLEDLVRPKMLIRR